MSESSSSRMAPAGSASGQPGRSMLSVRDPLRPIYVPDNPQTFQKREETLFDKLYALHDRENRNFVVVPLCVLAYLFDRRQAIPASVIAPVNQGREEWMATLKYLSALGLLDVYLDSDGKACVAFGKPPDRAKQYKDFVGSDLRDMIESWTFEVGWFDGILEIAVRTVDVFNRVGGDDDFPSLNTLHRLMKVYSNLIYLVKPEKVFKVSVIVEFGKMLLSKARGLNNNEEVAVLFEFVRIHLLGEMDKRWEDKTLPVEERERLASGRRTLRHECQRFMEPTGSIHDRQYVG